MDPLVEEWTADGGIDPEQRADEIRRLTVRPSACLQKRASAPLLWGRAFALVHAWLHSSWPVTQGWQVL